jgi:hypothetical protein
VAGTATATRNAVNRRQAPATPAQEDDVITQLERLGALHAQGILTDEEFASQKAKLLGI